MVDVLTGGVPCQPWSVCGKQKKEKDERNLWPETIECMRIIRPNFGYFENVANILNAKYYGRIIIELSKIGYISRWETLGGKEVNNVCDGERVWLLAFKTDCRMLEGMDIQKYIKPYSEESRRRQYTRAIGAMLSQDDYSVVKRDSHVVAGAMDRLKAIGNGQVPGVAAKAWRVLRQKPRAAAEHYGTGQNIGQQRKHAKCAGGYGV